MKQLTRNFRLACALLFGAGTLGAQDVSVEPPDAHALLKEMAESYAAVTTYSDVGTAIYRNADGSENLSVKFRLWLARPGSFRVDAESTKPGSKSARREVLWTDGRTIRRWATHRPVSTLPRVQLVGSGMFGTYAYHVPTLLEVKYGAKRRLNDLTLPKLVGSEAINGVDCYEVSGQWEGDKYSIWIGKEEHRVRKMVAI